LRANGNLDIHNPTEFGRQFRRSITRTGTSRRIFLKRIQQG
jgi:hypothetical protein